MEEKAPTRQVGYPNPDGSTTYITQPKKWVNPAGKTMQEVLLEIGENMANSVGTNERKKEDIEDLLEQAQDILWQKFQDKNHSLYCFVSEQLNKLRRFGKQNSQGDKVRLLKDIAKESRFRIENYFETGE